MTQRAPASTRFALLGAASLLLAALTGGCSAAPDAAPSASSDEAMTACGARTCDNGGDPPSQCSAFTLPYALRRLGCTGGVYISGGYGLLCPIGANLPAKLGLPKPPSLHLLIESYVISTTYSDQCIGPYDGYEEVLDSFSDGGGGGCRGPCADPN